MTYDSPKQIAQYLKERGITLKKRFGQNFLVSSGVRRKLVSLLDLGPKESVWEVGPGIGSMTHMLIGTARRVVAFEIDHGLVRILDESFGDDPTFLLIAGDYLKTWAAAAQRYGFPDAVLGNLPYNAAAPIIASMADWERPVGRAVFTVQREVARRMAASPGTKDYSSFSMICQARFEVRLHGDIAPASFHPVPEVTSTIVRLLPNGLERPSDWELFKMIVRVLFAARRKTIRNNLLSKLDAVRYPRQLVDAALENAAIDPSIRGEQLSVREVTALVAALGGSSRR